MDSALSYDGAVRRDGRAMSRLMTKLPRVLAGLLAISACCAAHAAQSGPDALVVTDDISVQVSPGATAVISSTVQRKALTQAGLASVAAVSIPYNAERGKLYVREARIIHPDGTSTMLGDAAISDRPYPGTTDAPAYSSIRRIMVRFSGVEVGDTVELRTAERQTKAFLPGDFSLFQTFDRTMPIESASVLISAPAYLDLHIQANNMQGGQIEADAGRRTWRFTAKQVPPLVNIASVSDRLAKSPWVLASTFATEQQAAGAYLYRIDQPAKISLELQHLADTLGEGSVDPSVLMHRYYEWINAHIRLISIPLQLAPADPRSASDILLSGYGTAEDRVILLRGLMQAKAVSTDVVLVPSRSIYWKPQVYALPAFYGRVLLTAPGQSEVLDVGSTSVELGSFDPIDRGKSGLRISPSGNVIAFQVPEVDPADASNTVVTNATLAPDGTLSGATNVIAFGDLATSDEQAFKQETPAALRSKLMLDGSHGAIVEVVASGPDTMSGAGPDSDDTRRRFHYTARFTVPNFAPNQYRPNPKGRGKPVLDLEHPLPMDIQVPREVVGLSNMDTVARAQGGLCQRTMRSELVNVRIPFPESLVHLPSDVDVGKPGGVAHYSAEYSFNNGELSVLRVLSIAASPTNCDRAQRKQIEAVAQALRSDLQAQIQIGDATVASE